MFRRALSASTRSFFLFGPRATGKTTWLAQTYPNAFVVDLLDNETYFRLASTPGAFRDMVRAQPRDRWVVVDEVQRLPALLNDVQLLMGEKRRFALTGSSARKLKRGRANLLAGRAVVRNMFPLVHAEYGTAASLEEVLRFGTLPAVVADPAARVDVLEAYAGTYLREEIKEEALTRNVDAFARFLPVAALANAQVTNLASIARDAMVARATVTTYFEILVDTLIGRFLPAYTARARVKEVAHPKFYLFDTGVVRALQDRLRETPTADERGHLLETYVFHELVAHTSYHQLGGQWHFWRTPDGVEVDFLWTSGRRAVALEVKAAPRWDARDEAGLEALRAALPQTSLAAGVYLGKTRLKRPFGTVYPIIDFLEAFATGEIRF
jgi:predicted AAA+ superfamily ATPase